MKRRGIQEVLEAVPASDGAGVRLKRVMALQARELMDPFLMLDEIRADSEDELGAGFPPHPHRGIETISCMLKGGFRHEDHMGNRREVNNGGMQWMTAGRGVIHSEMPLPEQGTLHGFQIWLNLPADRKMVAPDYHDVRAEEIPEVSFDGGRGRILAGQLQLDGTEYLGAVQRDVTDPLVLDINMNGNGRLLLPVNAEKLMVYVYRGQVSIECDGSSGTLQESALGILSDTGDLEITAAADSGFLVLGGTPLNESVVQHGPFVMNTREEIDQAISDYREGRLVNSASPG
ncbi:MAG: pirin family protein [Endozoicomonas sp.]